MEGEHFSRPCSSWFAGPLQAAWLQGTVLLAGHVGHLQLGCCTWCYLCCCWGSQASDTWGAQGPAVSRYVLVGWAAGWCETSPPHGGKCSSSAGSPARRVGACLEMGQGPPQAGTTAQLQAAASRRAADSCFALHWVSWRSVALMKLRAVDQCQGCESLARVIQGTWGGWAPPAHRL